MALSHYISPAVIQTVNAAGLAGLAASAVHGAPTWVPVLAGVMGIAWYGIQIFQDVTAHRNRGKLSPAALKDQQTQEAIALLLKQAQETAAARLKALELEKTNAEQGSSASTLPVS